MNPALILELLTSVVPPLLKAIQQQQLTTTAPAPAPIQLPFPLPGAPAPSNVSVLPTSEQGNAGGTSPSVSTGDDVIRSIQVILKAFGADVAVDGLYGPKTEAALTAAATALKAKLGV